MRCRVRSNESRRAQVQPRLSQVDSSLDLSVCALMKCPLAVPESISKGLKVIDKGKEIKEIKGPIFMLANEW